MRGLVMLRRTRMIRNASIIATPSSLQRMGRPALRKRGVLGIAKRLKKYLLLAILIGLTYSSYQLLCIAPKTTSDYCIGYEANQWAIECRFGRLTYYRWLRAVSVADRDSAVWPTSKDPLDFTKKIIAFRDRLPQVSAMGWFCLSGREACKIRSNIIYYQEHPRWETWSEGGYPPAIARRHIELKYPLGAALCAEFTLLGFFLMQSLRQWRGSEKTITCRECYYCLRGNSSGTCPECGTVIPDEQRAQLAGAAGSIE
ncbi:hypothetical protein RAS2_15800 [Phycisphaerae bacterium RAS2]|nr:hypothetical protein RAS2_15800 [Phycisphaerae bacterium RAS2]